MRFALCVLALAMLLLHSCAQRIQRTIIAPEDMATVDRKAPYLKVHMHDGTLYVLSPWKSEEVARSVQGHGQHFGVDRRVLEQGDFVVPLDSIVLFETNVARPSPSVAQLAVITGISAAVTVACALNPKACFGSCPTFYVEDGRGENLVAEGFSASIAPHLEATDVDALLRTNSQGPELRVHMLNEAYETHVVRSVQLLALPRKPKTRVFHDGQGGFWSTDEPLAASSCRGPEGDCTGLLAAFDGIERRSVSDSTDLAARETIELHFDTTSSAPALVLASRQSLLPTYLLYQGLSYLGSSLGTWMARFERGGDSVPAIADALVATLGGVEVLVPDGAGDWQRIATVQETGPLATDVRLIPLPNGSDRVRLRMPKGGWRVDWVGLTTLRERVTPQRFDPVEVRRGERRDALALDQLRVGGEALVSFPGDRTTLVFELPDATEHWELFLESRGYYLEWMRKEWLAEEDLTKAAALLMAPQAVLRRLAPDFHRVEAALDSAFWRSKYAGF